MKTSILLIAAIAAATSCGTDYDTTKEDKAMTLHISPPTQ